MDRIVIEGRKLINGIERTYYALPRNKEFLGSPISGIRLFIANGRIDFTSTNGYRLAMYSSKLVEDKVRRKRAYTVPAREIKELIKNVHVDEEIEIVVEDDKMVFNGVNFNKTVDIIQGRYPSYHRIIPKEYNIKIKASKNRLIDAINSVIKERPYKDSEAGRYEKVVLRLQGKRLVVSTVSPKDPLPEDYRSRICDIPVEVIHDYLNVKGEEYASPYVCLNEIYLKNAMKPISGAKVVLGFVNEYSPIAFISPDPAYGYLGLVMPMDPENCNQMVLAK
jgi:DNA polymerase III sliding clamp (beta) subunit (PCNA family)